MNLATAQRMADALVAEITPFVEKCAIAGSIRRKKPDGIKDIELLAIAKWQPVKAGLFAEDVSKENLLYKWAMSQGTIRWIKTGTSEIIPWDIKEDGKYWRGIFPNDTKLDLFLTKPESWSIQMLIRTGPADWSNQFVTSKRVKTHSGRYGTLPIGMRVAGGRLWKGDTALDTPDEETVFKLVGREYLPPEKRV